MKKLFLFLAFIFVSFISSNAQELPCLTKVHPDTSSIPKYLKQGWGQVDSAKVVIVFVDFPDGRFIRGNDTLQPLDESGLSMVLHKDAAGEVGLSPEVNNFYVGHNNQTNLDLYMKPAKYSWHDRWQMYFSKDGSYNGTVHPDYVSNGELAYGSFAEYWQEVSHGLFNIQPAVTHPLEQSYEMQRGILNNYIDMGNGRYVVDYLTLPYNKYGNDSNSCYFPNGSVYSFWPNEYWNRDVSRIEKMQNDCMTTARRKFTNFNFDEFFANNGTIIFIMAGGHYRFKGMGYNYLLSPHKYFTLIRGRTDTLDGASSCLGGIGVMAHEFAHVTPKLLWGHTNSGRYCIMNFIDVHDRNCPQHPSPFLKIQEGWLTPIALEHTQTGAVIPPVETSHQVGIVTVYGKPTAYPDIQTGEYYILENRRLLGFDRKVVGSPPLNFRGGLLLWHYSPYNRVVPYSDGSGACQSVQLRAPFYRKVVSDTIIIFGDSVYLAGSIGDEKHFYAWEQNPDSANYTYRDSNRTYSSFHLKTGLAFNNITNDYNNYSGNITLDINYKISDPPNYSFVMYSDGTSNQTCNWTGNIYIHNSNNENKYIFREGSSIDVINGLSLKAVKCYGTENNHITINGAGYSTYRTKSGFSVLNLSNPLLSDSIIINYCDLYNSISNNVIIPGVYNNDISIEHFNVYDTSVSYQFYGNQSNTPHLSKYSDNNISKIRISSTWYFDMLNDFIIPENTKIENNEVCDVNTDPTVFDFSSLTQSKIICNGKMKILSDFKCNRDIEIGSSGEIDFSTCSTRNVTTTIKFPESKGIICYGKFTASTSYTEPNKNLIFTNDGGNKWNGIYCYNSNSFNMDRTIYQNSLYGIQISHGSPTVNISNSSFSGNQYSDIYLESFDPTSSNVSGISNNYFDDFSTQLYAIGCNDVSNVYIMGNKLDSICNIGIYLSHSSSDIELGSNQIDASLYYNHNSTAGIYCYYSDPYLKCNEVTNFFDGILFDASSPYLFNNEIYNNGVGLYLANGSNPIMSPSYSPNQGWYNAGYNQIYNNLNEEIYCNNNDLLSLPYIDIGYNSVYDSAAGILINTNLGYFDPPLHGSYNFWGTVPDDNMFSPSGSVGYSPYLTSPQLYQNCLPQLLAGNYDSLSQNTLLFGSSNIQAYSNNYSSAINGYKQIINNYSSNLLNSLVSSKLFFTYLKSHSSFSELATYYSTIAGQHQNDTGFYKRARNLMIGSHVNMPLYQQAINEYQDIINTSQSENEIYYATVEKLRTVELMLDTLLNHQGGDNPGGGNIYPLPELSQLLKGFYQNNLNLISPKIKSSKNDNSNININSSQKVTKDVKSEKDTNPVKNSKSDVKNVKPESKKDIRNRVSKTDFKMSSSQTNKENSIDNLKKDIKLDNIDLSKMKKKDVINLINKVIVVKLIERSLLNYTPSERPLFRMKSNRNGKTEKIEKPNLIPKEYKLYQNYPNPFNPVTKINYDLPKDGTVKLVIYDILGREVKILVNEFKKAGSYLIEFNGSAFSSGIYFYRIQVDGGKGFIAVKKMVLVK